jgi:hypothetical protein
MRRVECRAYRPSLLDHEYEAEADRDNEQQANEAVTKEIHDWLRLQTGLNSNVKDFPLAENSGIPLRVTPSVRWIRVPLTRAADVERR